MEDFKEIFMFAVGLIMTAFVIVMIGVFINFSSQMGGIRQSELSASHNVKEAKQYFVYDNRVITGADVIALLRENALTGQFKIYIDRNAENMSMSMTETNYTNSSWNLIELVDQINLDDKYTATLFYGYDDPAAVSISISYNSMVTGVRIIKS